MNITILCTSPNHPVVSSIKTWMGKTSGLNISLIETQTEAKGGDILFLISCHEYVARNIRDLFLKCLVIHASDLPRGRGWSPHIWEILRGNNQVVATLLEAADTIDRGEIWAKRYHTLEGHELYDEINAVIGHLTIELMEDAIGLLEAPTPRVQQEELSTYYSRRTPEDSRLLPEKTIAEQFDLLRVADPERYPSFVDYRGYRYEIRLVKRQRIVEES